MSEEEDTEKKVVKCDLCGEFVLVKKNESKLFMQITCPKCGGHGRLFPREMIR